jgi:hypothetical protein
MNLKISLILFLSVLSLIACRRLPDVQGPGLASIQGVWNEDQVEHLDQLLNYTQQKIKFTCDSFYVELTTHSKVNYYEDPCYNNGIWKEYAKGVYRVKNDSLFLEGTYTKSNYKQKTSGCFQIGRYLKTIYISSIKKDKLIFENITDQRRSTMVLKEKVVCTPKAL